MTKVPAKRRGRANHGLTSVLFVRVSPEMLARIDACVDKLRRTSGLPVSRAAAVRLLLAEGDESLRVRTH